MAGIKNIASVGAAFALVACLMAGCSKPAVEGSTPHSGGIGGGYIPAASLDDQDLLAACTPDPGKSALTAEQGRECDRLQAPRTAAAVREIADESNSAVALANAKAEAEQRALAAKELDELQAPVRESDREEAAREGAYQGAYDGARDAAENPHENDRP
jgi:hypothetical protein